MSKLIAFIATIAAIGLVALEIPPLFEVVSRVPWNMKLAVLKGLIDLTCTRLISVAPMGIYAVAALLIGILEGIYWRHKRVWKGYHRSVMEFALAPLVLAVGLILSWGLSLQTDPSYSLWLACLLLGVFGWSITAGYKPASVR